MSRLAVAAAALHAAPALALVPRVTFPGIACRLPSLREGVVLTFDDGPSPLGTRAVLEALAAASATATFFVVGVQVEAHRSVLAEIVAAGHEVALHGHRHVPHALLPPAIVRRDLERGLATIEDAIGTPVRALRAPFGAASMATLRFAAGNGLVLAGWRRWGLDWLPGASPASIARRVTTGARAGDILLLHDADTYSAAGSWRATARAIPAIVETLRGGRLACVSLREATAAARDPSLSGSGGRSRG